MSGDTKCDRCINKSHEGAGVWFTADWWRCMPCILFEMEVQARQIIDTLTPIIAKDESLGYDVSQHRTILDHAAADLKKLNEMPQRGFIPPNPLRDLRQAVHGYRRSLDMDRRVREEWADRVAQRAMTYLNTVNS